MKTCRKGLHQYEGRRCLECCKVARRAQSARYSAAHPERIKAYNAKWLATHRKQKQAQQAAWQKAHPERVKAAQAKYYASHRDACIARARERRAANPERQRAYNAKSHAAHREARNAYSMVWALEHPGAARQRHLVRNYRMAPEQYDDLLKSQGGGCAICGAKNDGCGRRLAIDHDHRCCPTKKTCGKCVRGLLCGNCNRVLGLLKDDPVRAQRLTDYLRNKVQPQ